MLRLAVLLVPLKAYETCSEMGSKQKITNHDLTFPVCFANVHCGKGLRTFLRTLEALCTWKHFAIRYRSFGAVCLLQAHLQRSFAASCQLLSISMISLLLAWFLLESKSATSSSKKINKARSTIAHVKHRSACKLSEYVKEMKTIRITMNQSSHGPFNFCAQLQKLAFL